MVDASPYFGKPTLSKALQRLCAENGFGYIPLGDRLLAANASGVATRWRRDGHFNESGNAIFADSMREWLTEHARHALHPAPRAITTAWHLGGPLDTARDSE